MLIQWNSKGFFVCGDHVHLVSRFQMLEVVVVESETYMIHRVEVPRVPLEIQMRENTR